MLTMFTGICFSSSPPLWLPPSPAWTHGEGISIRSMWTWCLEPFLALGPWSSYSTTELQFFFFFLKDIARLTSEGYWRIKLSNWEPCMLWWPRRGLSHPWWRLCLIFSDLSPVLIIIPPESVISWLINKWTLPTVFPQNPQFTEKQWQQEVEME